MPSGRRDGSRAVPAAACAAQRPDHHVLAAWRAVRFGRGEKPLPAAASAVTPGGRTPGRRAAPGNSSQRPGGAAVRGDCPRNGTRWPAAVTSVPVAGDRGPGWPPRNSSCAPWPAPAGCGTRDKGPGPPGGRQPDRPARVPAEADRDEPLAGSRVTAFSAGCRLSLASADGRPAASRSGPARSTDGRDRAGRPHQLVPGDQRTPAGFAAAAVDGPVPARRTRAAPVRAPSQGPAVSWSRRRPGPCAAVAPPPHRGASPPPAPRATPVSCSTPRACPAPPGVAARPRASHVEPPSAGDPQRGEAVPRCPPPPGCGARCRDSALTAQLRG